MSKEGFIDAAREGLEYPEEEPLCYRWPLVNHSPRPEQGGAYVTKRPYRLSESCTLRYVGYVKTDIPFFRMQTTAVIVFLSVNDMEG
jgi:hypothetical protein